MEFTPIACNDAKGLKSLATGSSLGYTVGLSTNCTKWSMVVGEYVLSLVAGRALRSIYALPILLNWSPLKKSA